MRLFISFYLLLGLQLFSEAQLKDTLLLPGGVKAPCTIDTTLHPITHKGAINYEDSLQKKTYLSDAIIATGKDGQRKIYSPAELEGFYLSTGFKHPADQYFITPGWHVTLTVPATSLTKLLAKKEINKKKFMQVLEKGKYITLYETRMNLDDGKMWRYWFGSPAGGKQLQELMTNLQMKDLCEHCPAIVYKDKYDIYEKDEKRWDEFLLNIAKDYNADKCNE